MAKGREELETLSAITAYLEGRRLYIPNASGLLELRERGYGTLKGNALVLSPFEALYLLEKGKIELIDKPSKKPLSVKRLARLIAKTKPDVLVNYLIYRDLRERGYIVRDAPKVSFEIYGKGPARRLVTVIYEGKEASLKRLKRLLGYARSQGKELIVAVIDRRTEIVYYSAAELHP